MSKLYTPPQGLVLGSFLYHQDFLHETDLKKLWQQHFGPSFFFTHPYCPMKRYYAQEMGSEECLERFFLVSENLFDRSQLSPAKFWAIAQEEKYEQEGKRRLNLDIGMITLENVQLATGKNFTHRVYLGEGLYADLTLIFQQNTYQTLPWTYPDYAHPEVIEGLNQRRKYLQSKVLNQYTELL